MIRWYVFFAALAVASGVLLLVLHDQETVTPKGSSIAQAPLSQGGDTFTPPQGFGVPTGSEWFRVQAAPIAQINLGELRPVEAKPLRNNTEVSHIGQPLDADYPELSELRGPAPEAIGIGDSRDVNRQLARQDNQPEFIALGEVLDADDPQPTFNETRPPRYKGAPIEVVVSPFRP